MAKNQNNRNKQVKPLGGLYEGEFGADAAKNDPLAFYNHALANEGRTGLNTSPFAWDYLQNQGFNNIFSGYQGAQAGNEDLQFSNYMANRYGASPTMTVNNPYYTAPAPAPTVVDQEWGAGGQGLGGRRRKHRRPRSQFANNSVLGG